jgi:polysaccharide pyruvyl transferase WcaK-like protein
MGGGNLGDDATVEAVIQHIHRRWPHAEIIALSMNPADTALRHGIPSYPIRRQNWSREAAPEQIRELSDSGLRAAVRRHQRLYRWLRPLGAVVNASVRAILGRPDSVTGELRLLIRSVGLTRKLDILVICGGGQLLDSWGGPWRFPFTLFKWTFLARLLRVPCFFLNVGAGPLRQPLSRWFIRRALFLADYASFRDSESRALIEQIGFTGRTEVHPDNAYSLEFPRESSASSLPENEIVAGIAPMAYCDPRRYWEKDAGIYRGFLKSFSDFGTWLTNRQSRVALFSTDIDFDAQTLADLRSLMAAGGADAARIALDPTPTREALFARMASMDFLVTCRFHGVVFAHLMNIPVIALSHHPKVRRLMQDIGLSEYCVDIRNFDGEVLATTYTSLVSNREEIKSRMAVKLAEYRHDLAAQFDNVFSSGRVFRSARVFPGKLRTERESQ